MKSMIHIQLLLLFCCSTLGAVYSNSYGQELGNLASLIPNLNYTLSDTNYIKLTNGVLTSSSGDYHSASLNDRVLFGDINNDGHPDAAVSLFVIYQGIGYFANILFVVLSTDSGVPLVIGGELLGIAIYNIDLFSFDAETKRIIVGYTDRLPGQPKVILPTVPTIVNFEVKDNKLVVKSKVIDKTCYSSVTENTTILPPPSPAVDCPYRNFMKDGVCVRVSDQCKTWSTSTGECLTCYDGYKLSQGACVIDGGSGSGSGNGNCPYRTVRINGNCVAVSNQCKTWS